jgi:hypothetical protein
MKANLSHNILTEMCKVKNQSSSAKGSYFPITPRVEFIVDTILDLGFHNHLYLDVFKDSDNKGLEYVNVELSFIANSDINKQDSVIFVAHHDINNPNSDNCQDNTASVSNLLALANKLFLNKPTNKNVFIVFTDCEEFGGKGAERLSNRILEGNFGNVEYIVNLELTANGSNIWTDSKNFISDSVLLETIKSLEEVTDVKTPFNDSVIFRKNGFDSVCVGTLTNEDLKDVLGRGFCQTWALCHKMNDTIENANAKEMNNFVEFLFKLI